MKYYHLLALVIQDKFFVILLKYRSLKGLSQCQSMKEGKHTGHSFLLSCELPVGFFPCQHGTRLTTALFSHCSIINHVPQESF